MRPLTPNPVRATCLTDRIHVACLLAALALSSGVARAAACEERVEVTETVDLTCGQVYNGFAVLRDTVVRRLILGDAGAGVCDTLITTTLDVHGNDYYQSVTLCAGGSLTVGDAVYTQSGRYETSIPRVDGACDSVVFTQLTVLRPIEVAFTQQLCAGDAFAGLTIARDTVLERRGVSYLGCDSVTRYELDVFTAEALSVAGAREACFGESLRLEASSGYRDYAWSDGQRGRRASFSESGPVSVRVAGGQGCTAQVDLDLRFYEPYFEVATRAADCPEAGGVAEVVEIMDAKAPVLYELAARTQRDSVFEGLAPGRYDVAVVDAMGCRSERQFDLPEPRQDSLTITGLPTATTPVGTPLAPRLVGVDSAGVSSVTWRAGGGLLDCATCLTPEWLPGGAGVLEVEVTTAGGCRLAARAEVALRERNPFEVPTGISPDGDGVNDELRYFAADPVAAIEDFVLVDRWGSAIQVRAPDVAATDVLWDGTSAGRALDAGVYVYQLRVRFADGETRQLSGEVTLVR